MFVKFEGFSPSPYKKTQATGNVRKLTIIDPLSLQVIYVKWNKKCSAVVQNKKNKTTEHVH